MNIKLLLSKLLVLPKSATFLFMAGFCLFAAQADATSLTLVCPPTVGKNALVCPPTVGKNALVCPPTVGKNALVCPPTVG